jgi:TLD
MEIDYTKLVKLLQDRLTDLKVSNVQLTSNPAKATLLLTDDIHSNINKDETAILLSLTKFAEFMEENLKEEKSLDEQHINEAKKIFSVIRNELNKIMDDCERKLMKTCIDSKRTHDFMADFGNGILNDNTKFKTSLDEFLRSVALSPLEKLRKDGLGEISKMAVHIPQELKKIVNECLKFLNPMAVQPVNTPAIESSIVGSSQDFSIFITGHLKKIGVPVTKYELLYRGSRDGFSASAFHSKCDNKGATLVLLKTTTNHIFGGFAQKPWTSYSSGVFIADPKAFLYSWNLKEIYSNKSPDGTNALTHNTGWGPLFGEGQDFLISSDCNVNQKSLLRMNQTFSSNGKSVRDITGSDCNFQVSEYEVFLVL